MTEFEQKMLEKFEALERRTNELCQTVERLCANTSLAELTYYENLPPSAVVGTDYVCFRFNCSESAVVRGRFETDKIPRLREKPIAFVKREVDAVWHSLNQTVADKAAKIRHGRKNEGKTRH